MTQEICGIRHEEGSGGTIYFFLDVPIRHFASKGRIYYALSDLAQVL